MTQMPSGASQSIGCQGDLIGLPFSSRRLAFIFAVGCYYWVFVWAYSRFLLPWQEFWGFSYNDVEWEYWAAAFALAVLPSTWSPISLRRPSQLLFLFQYIVLYVPLTVVLFHSGHPRIDALESLQAIASMCLGLFFIALVYRFPLLHLPRLHVPPIAFWTGMLAITVSLFMFVGTGLGANFKLVALADIYEVRGDAARLVAESSRFVWYAQLWLSGAILPVIFAWAFLHRNFAIMFLVFLGYLFLFGVTGTKTTLLAIAILIGLSLVLSVSRRNYGFTFVIAVVLALSVPLVFVFFGDYGEILEKWYVVLVHARIFGIPQLILAQYLEFFQQHPVTLWSHVAGLNALSPYPYLLDVPRTVGNYYYGVPVGLNSGFWGQDGIAAAGIEGVILISLLVALVFWVFDSLVARVDLRLSVPSLGVVAIWFTNAPITTTLWSGGWILLTIILCLIPVPRTQGRLERDNQSAGSGGFSNKS